MKSAINETEIIMEITDTLIREATIEYDPCTRTVYGYVPEKLRIQVLASNVHPRLRAILGAISNNLPIDIAAFLR